MSEVAGRPRRSMVRIRSTSRPLAREEGFTLPELLTAMTLLLLLLAVMGVGLAIVMRAQPRVAERSAQVQAGRAMTDRLTRELREGSQVTVAVGSTISFLTYVRTAACGSGDPLASSASPAIQCRVTYTCVTAGTCSRTEAQTDGSNPGPAVTAVEGLRSSQVFGYWPSSTQPRHVSVTLEYPGEGGTEAITLSDGAALRNTAGGLPST